MEKGQNRFSTIMTNLFSGLPVSLIDILSLPVIIEWYG
jgi:hypothetical protein